MNEIAELYAACMVEYAGMQPDGILSGPFYMFGKDARDNFNLPYDEKVFEEALKLLERIGSLKRYKREAVQTYYQLNSKSFKKMMSDTGDGRRYYQTLQDASATAKYASISGSILPAFSTQFYPRIAREPTLLEAYADLGSHYLSEVLEALEPKLQLIESDENPIVDISNFSAVEKSAPASDRLVSFDHNAPDYSEITKGITELLEQVRGSNDLSVDDTEKERILQSLKAAADLWSATQLKIIQIKIGVLLAVEDAQKALKSTARAVVPSLLIDLIKAFVRNHAGIDLDNI